MMISLQNNNLGFEYLPCDFQRVPLLTSAGSFLQKGRSQSSRVSFALLSVIFLRMTLACHFLPLLALEAIFGAPEYMHCHTYFDRGYRTKAGHFPSSRREWSHSQSPSSDFCFFVELLFLSRFVIAAYSFCYLASD